MPTFTTTISARNKNDHEARACVDVTYRVDEDGDISLLSVVVDEPTICRQVDILDELADAEKMTLFDKAQKHEEENR